MPEKKKGGGGSNRIEKPKTAESLLSLVAKGQAKRIEYDKQLTPDQLDQFCESLKTNTRLTYLSFSYTKLEVVGLKKVLAALKENTTLVELKFQRCYFGTAGVKVVRNFLKKNTTIKKLGLLNCLVKKGAVVVAELIKENTTLTALDLNVNRFVGENGIQEIADALKINVTLNTLGMGGCGLKDNGTYILCQALKNHPTIKSVDLYGNQISNQGAEAVSELIASSKIIHHLFLNNNQIRDSGLHFIINALTKNTALKSLDLKNNPYGKGSAERLKKVAAHAKALKTLKVDDGKNNRSSVQKKEGGGFRSRVQEKKQAAKPNSKPFETEVGMLLKNSNLAMFVHKFYDERIFDLEMAATLSNEDLKEIGVKSLGDRVRIKAVFASGGAGETTEEAKDAPVENYDVFLTHNWSDDLHGRNNHERVSKVNGLLKEKGIKTWFDDEKLTGNIPLQMSRGIDNSSVVVVFITKTYMEKINSDRDDNCKREFQYAVLSKSTQQIVAVVMEEEMKDPKSWKGVLGMELGNMLYIDMSQDDLMEANLAHLLDQIKEKMALDEE